jgi:hypothetical protein
VRRSLNLTNWEAANRLINQWEIHGLEQAASVSDATDRWLSDCEARQLKPQSIKKYREIKKELDRTFGKIIVRKASVDDIRKLRESWKYSALTTGKRLEFLRAFFSFCADSGWIEKNPAQSVKLPKVKQSPTLPFFRKWKNSCGRSIRSGRSIRRCRRPRAAN